MNGFQHFADSIEIFKELGGEERKEIAQLLNWSKYVRKQHVIVHEDKSRDVYFLGSGRVRATIYSPSGKEISYEDLDAGRMFGELSAIDSQPRSMNVIVLEDSTIASMSSANFTNVRGRYPAVSEAVLKHVVAEMRAQSNRVFEFGAMSVKGRVYQELYRLATKEGMDTRVVIDNMPSHSEIASRVSTHREAVARVMSELQKMGIAVKQAGRQFVIADIERLRQLARAAFE